MSDLMHNSTSYVIKQLVHAFSYMHYQVMEHVGSLDSTQEARVASLMLLMCSPNFLLAP